ncbi:MAG: dienelactone hydrolase family protein [Acidimicrobiales bacterium]
MPTRDVTLPTPAGPMRLYEAVPDTGSPAGAVVVVQEAFGVNAHIEDVTGRFARAGFHAVAPDLFHRSGGGTAPYDDFGAVLPLFEGLSGDDDLLVDVDAAVDHLRAAGWSTARIGVVGFCFGGRVSFLVALRRRLGAAVGFYGGGIVTGRFPQFPPLIEEAGGLQTPWLGLFGDLDESIPVADVERLAATLVDRAAVPAEVVRYPDAGHGFHCDQRPSYVEADALDAWDRTVAWFARFLADGVG